MASVNETIKNTTQDLEDLRHTLLNGTTGIADSLRKIEHTLAYMSEALKIYNKIVENNDAETKTI